MRNSINKHVNKIEKVINELCPDGVTFIEMYKVLEKTSNIRWQDVQNEEFKYIDLTSVDRITHIIGNTETINGETAPSRAQQIVREGDVLFGTTRPMLKRYCLIPTEYDGQICTTGYCVLRSKIDVLLPNFLFHVLSTAYFYAYVEANERGASYPAISDNIVKKYRIPIPPLAIQQEIVNILDTFTTLEAELETELERELEARKKQYKYYREDLLTFGDDVEWKALGEVAEIGTGSSNTNEEIEDGVYPFFVRSPVVRFKNTFEFDETAIITSGDGVGVGKIFHFVEGKYALHQRAYRIHIIDHRINPKFFFFYMRNTFEKYILGNAVNSSVTSVRRPMLNKYPVPILPLDEQDRIVAILDKFDALVNDISFGLPAELNARRKQYEYYREKLLTFKKLNSPTLEGCQSKTDGVV